MNAKLNRLKKIRSYLRTQSSPQTITEVFEALVKRLGEDISRKTIERDMDELIEARAVVLMPGLPSRFQLAETDQIELTLSAEEIRTILALLNENTETHLKLKKILQNN